MKSIQVENTKVGNISEEDIKSILNDFSDNVYLKQNLILFICDKNDIESYKKEVIERFISRMRRDYMMVYIFIILICIIFLILYGLFFDIISPIDTKKLQSFFISNTVKTEIVEKYITKNLAAINPNSIIYTLFIFSILIIICSIYLSYFLWNNRFTSNIRQWWSTFFLVNSYFKVCEVLLVILIQSCCFTYFIFNTSSNWRSPSKNGIEKLKEIRTRQDEEKNKKKESTNMYSSFIFTKVTTRTSLEQDCYIMKSIIFDIDNDIEYTFTILIFLIMEISYCILCIFVVFFYFIPNNCEDKDCDLQKVIEKIKILKKEKELKEKRERLKKEKERLKKEKEIEKEEEK